MPDKNKTVERIIAEADRYHDAGELEKALDCLREARTLETDPLVLCRLGGVAMELSRWDEAETAFRQAIDLMPELAIGFESLGVLYQEQSKHSLAVSCFERSVELGENARRLTFLGFSQMSLGDDVAASASLERALEIDHSYEEAYYNLGMLSRDDGQRAVGLFRKAVELDPAYGIAHRELGWALRKLDAHDEAELHLRRALELDDSDGWAHIYLGNLLWAKNSEAAERSFLNAVRHWKDNAVPYWCLAMFYEYEDRPKEAEFFYESALRLDPDDIEANLRFGRFLKEVGETERAEAYLERARILDPDRLRANPEG
jgi:tetratricopeptide (TPR) repeat protein